MSFSNGTIEHYHPFYIIGHKQNSKDQKEWFVLSSSGGSELHYTSYPNTFKNGDNGAVKFTAFVNGGEVSFKKYNVNSYVKTDSTNGLTLSESPTHYIVSGDGPTNHIRSGIKYSITTADNGGVEANHAISDSEKKPSSPDETTGKTPQGVFDTIVSGKVKTSIDNIYFLAVDSYYPGGVPVENILVYFEQWVQGKQIKVNGEDKTLAEVDKTAPRKVSIDKDAAVFADWSSAKIAITDSPGFDKCGARVGVCSGGHNCVTDMHSEENMVNGKTDHVYVCSDSDRMLDAHANHYNTLIYLGGSLVAIMFIIGVILLNHHSKQD